MSNQLHRSQEVKQPLFLTQDEMIMHITKRNMLGFYGIYRLGRPPKDSKLANSPIDTKKKNTDKTVQKRENITEKVNWSSDD